MSIASNTTLIIFACGAGWGQPSEPRPQFEVASVKPAPPPEQRSGGRGAPRSTGGARTPDPSLFICDSCTLSELVLSAFYIQPYQLSAPGWMESERFTVNARVPVGTTVEQLRLMQQNLLAERFKLTYHHEEKEMPRWELVVAKGGPKLKASVGEPTGAQTAASQGRPLRRMGALARGTATGRWQSLPRYCRNRFTCRSPISPY